MKYLLILLTATSGHIFACEDPIRSPEFDKKIVVINEERSKGVVSTQIQVPRTIEGHQLSGLYLLRKESGKYMSLQLSVSERKDTYFAEFSLAKSNMYGVEIQAWYPKNGCPIIASKPAI